jgi:hypothetical protein
MHVSMVLPKNQEERVHTMAPLGVETAEGDVKATGKQCKKDRKIHFTEKLFIFSIILTELLVSRTKYLSLRLRAVWRIIGC